MNQKITAFDPGALGHDLDDADGAVSRPYLAADFNIFATLDFSLVQHLRDKLAIGDLRHDGIDRPGALSGLAEVNERTGSNQNGRNDAKNNERSCVASTWSIGEKGCHLNLVPILSQIEPSTENEGFCITDSSSACRGRI